MKLKYLMAMLAICMTAHVRAADPTTADHAQHAPNAREAPQAHPPTPAEAAQNAGVVIAHNGGSLLRAALTAPQPDPGQIRLDGVSYFAVPTPEPRVMKKHDLVTIIVREVSEIKSEGTTDLKRNADIDAKIDQFVKLNLSNWALEPAIGATPPQIKMSAARNFKGEGTFERDDSFVTRITAEVIDVKPNGTLALQARTHIRTDDEEQTIILSGVCRAEDISADNTILSTQLHDKDVSKMHKGAVRDAQKRGWVIKLLDAVNPF